MVEGSFQKLSERFYKSSPWPSVELIADVVDHDHVFCLLYKVGMQDLCLERHDQNGRSVPCMELAG
jgi:hypothetical protein